MKRKDVSETESWKEIRSNLICVSRSNKKKMTESIKNKKITV